MITPALLITATGTFILSTSNRLGRVVDRVRVISASIDALVHNPMGFDNVEERKRNLLAQIQVLSRRGKLLQRTMTVLYVASCVFVLTSVAIGVDALLPGLSIHWIPAVLGVGGACSLLYASLMLILEARLALRSLYDEMTYLNKIAHLSLEVPAGVGESSKERGPEVTIGG